MGAVRHAHAVNQRGRGAETRLPSSFVSTVPVVMEGGGFTTALQLLHDFWREVKRTLDEKGIPNDL